MKNLRELFPGYDQYGWNGPSYKGLVESFEYESVLWQDDNDYQGDSRVLLYDEHENRFGFLTFGWGSCSGCDALQGCTSYENLESLQQDLFGSIVWFETIELLADYFLTHDWNGDFAYSPEFNEKVLMVTKALTISLSGEEVDEVVRKQIKQWSDEAKSD